MEGVWIVMVRGEEAWQGTILVCRLGEGAEEDIRRASKRGQLFRWGRRIVRGELRIEETG